MKRKVNSLLGKITEENRLNNVEQRKKELDSKNRAELIQNSKETLRDYEDYVIDKDTELRRRLSEIWDLQKVGDYESAVRIFELLEEEFDYKYPFYCVTHDYGTSLSDLTKSDNLKNHIVRESKLLKIIPLYDQSKSAFEEKVKLMRKLESGILVKSLKIIGVIAFLPLWFFGVLVVGSNYGFGWGLLAFVVMPTILMLLFALVISPIESNFEKKIEILKKTIMDINERIKTKANNV